MDVLAYLERIAYRGALAPTRQVLFDLHLAHLFAVPFENLSIHWGEPIILDEDALFDKVVRRRRGGFCYELNGLFAALLRQFGFAVTMLSAGVISEDGSFGPEFDHLVLRVDLDEPWLADVGFGSSFHLPLRLDNDQEQAQDHAAFRLDRQGPFRLLYQRDPGGDWQVQYRFSLLPRRLDEFTAMCQYHQASPDSSFTRRKVCSLPLPDGRVTLRNSTLIITRDGARNEEELPDEATVRQALQQHFGFL